VEEHWGFAASDPLPAALWHGLANADGFPFPQGAGEKPWSKGRSLDEARDFAAGVQRPAPRRGGRAQRRFSTRESPEITRETIFSEGRGLRARVARPSACRGVLSPVVDTRKAGGFMTLRPRCAQPFPVGVRSPPLQGSQPKTDGLAGKTRAQRRGRFSRRGALCASGGVRPYANQGVSLHDLGWPVARGPTGRCLGQAPSPAGVRSPPLQGWTVQAKMALRGKPWHDAKADFLGGAHSVRPLDTAPTNAKAFHYGQGVGRIAGPLLVTCLASARALLPGVRSPPLQGSQPKTDGLAGKTRAQRRGRFSRRGAVSASGCRGRNQAQAQHDNRGQTNAWWPREHTPRSSASLPRGPAEPAPPCGPPYLAPFGDEQKDLFRDFFTESLASPRPKEKLAQRDCIRYQIRSRLTPQSYTTLRPRSPSPPGRRGQPPLRTRTPVI
jgi:hypothetical protein